MDKLPRGLAGLEASVGIDSELFMLFYGYFLARLTIRFPFPLLFAVPLQTVHLQVHTLLESTLSTLEPTFQTIEETVAKADDITIEELTHILRTAFAVIHKATGGLSGQLQRTSKTAKGGFSKRASIVDYSGVEERNLSDAEVAQVLSVLLNKVAGVVNLAEGLVEQLSILGPVLDPLFGQINGDLSLILSSVGNLLVGVVGLVRDLVSTIHGDRRFEVVSRNA